MIDVLLAQNCDLTRRDLDLRFLRLRSAYEENKNVLENTKG